MRIARAVVDGQPRIVVKDDGIDPARAHATRTTPSPRSASVRSGASAAWAGGRRRRRSNSLAPVAGAGKIIAVGLNYADHTAETGLTQPERPADLREVRDLDHRPARRHRGARPPHAQVDYEAELALVIGRRLRRTDARDARRRRRLHGRQRRVGPRRAVRRRAVDARQVVRHASPRSGRGSSPPTSSATRRRTASTPRSTARLCRTTTRRR